MSNTYYNVQLGNPKDKEQFWYPLTLKSNVVDLTTFVGATTAAAGVNGLVPAPAQKASSEDPDKFLCNDGSWKVVSGGGGGGSSTTYKTTLNNTLYGDSDGVSLGSWYAPSSGTTNTVGASISNQLLISTAATSAPAWTSFTLPSTGTNKLLSYTGGTGWSLVDMVTNTDRYVNSAAFADDTANDSTNPVKMTLTRAGSDTNTVTANIPKVSSTTAGVAPKGIAVTTQSQTTKFLREDGTWQAPSYTTNTDEKVKQTVDITNTIFPLLASAQSSPTSGTAYEAKYSSYAKLQPGSGSIILQNGTATGSYRTQLKPWSSDQPLMLYKATGTDSWTLENYRLITSNGLIAAPTGNNGDVKYLKATIGSNNAVTWGWGTPSSGGGDNYYHTPDYSTGLKIGTGTGVNNLYVPTATVNQYGLIKYGIDNVASGTFTYGNNGYWYPLQRDSNGRAWTQIPNHSVASVSGENPGLLQVTADADSAVGYQNTTYITAIPIFYGTITNLKTYDNTEQGIRYIKDKYKEGGKFVGHYVNVRDVVNGIVKNAPILQLLAEALGVELPKQ